MTEYEDDGDYSFYDQPEQPQDARVEQMLSDYEGQQAEAAYDSEMNRIVAQHPGTNPELLHPFVVAAEGNFDEAHTMFTNYNAINASHAEAAEQAGQSAEAAYEQIQKPSTIKDAVRQFMDSNFPS